MPEWWRNAHQFVRFKVTFPLTIILPGPEPTMVLQSTTLMSLQQYVSYRSVRQDDSPRCGMAHIETQNHGQFECERMYMHPVRVRDQRIFLGLPLELQQHPVRRWLPTDKYGVSSFFCSVSTCSALRDFHHRNPSFFFVSSCLISH